MRRKQAAATQFVFSSFFFLELRVPTVFAGVCWPTLNDSQARAFWHATVICVRSLPAGFLNRNERLVSFIRSSLDLNQLLNQLLS
jgi:hypothetical protein